MSLLRSSLWATAGNWGQQIFALVTMVVVARLLDPSAFGVIAIAMLFVLLFQRILLESVGFGVIRIEDDHYNDSFLDTSFWVGLTIGVLLALVMFFFADQLAHLFGEPSLAPVLKVMSVMPIVDALSVVQIGILRRELKFKVLALRTIGSNFLSGVVGVSMAFLGAGVWALVGQQLVAAFGSLLALWLSTNWKPGISWSGRSFYKIYEFGVPMFWNAILFVTNNRLDVAVLGALSGSANTGIYNISKRVSRSITDLFLTGATHVALSALSKGKDEEKNSVLIMQIKLVSLLTFPLYVGLASISSDLVPLILGEKWSDAVDVIAVLCVGGVLQVFILMVSNFFVARNGSKFLLLVNAIYVLAFLLLLLYFVSYGAIGAAFSFFVCNFFMVLMLGSILIFKYNFEPMNVIGSVLPPALCSLLMWVTLYVLSDFFADLENTYLILMAKVTFGSVVYLLLSMFIQKATLNTTFRLVRSRSSRISRN